MHIETIIPTLLNSLFGGRVWELSTPDNIPKGPDGEFLDFLIWDIRGGNDSEYVDQTMSDKTHARFQLAVFSRSGKTATDLLGQARDRLLASEYSVGVYGSPVGTYDSARKLKGRLQQFGIHFIK